MFYKSKPILALALGASLFFAAPARATSAYNADDNTPSGSPEKNCMMSPYSTTVLDIITSYKNDPPEEEWFAAYDDAMQWIEEKYREWGAVDDSVYKFQFLPLVCHIPSVRNENECNGYTTTATLLRIGMYQVADAIYGNCSRFLDLPEFEEMESTLRKNPGYMAIKVVMNIKDDCILEKDPAEICLENLEKHLYSTLEKAKGKF